MHPSNIHWEHSVRLRHGPHCAPEHAVAVPRATITRAAYGTMLSHQSPEHSGTPLLGLLWGHGVRAERRNIKEAIDSSVSHGGSSFQAPLASAGLRHIPTNVATCLPGRSSGDSANLSEQPSQPEFLKYQHSWSQCYKILFSSRWLSKFFSSSDHPNPKATD